MITVNAHQTAGERKMLLTGMTFGPKGGNEEELKKVSVTMSVEEALWIAIVSGQQHGSSPHNEINSCLVGNVFNRFWDDGVSDAISEYHIDTPPIKYEKD